MQRAEAGQWVQWMPHTVARLAADITQHADRAAIKKLRRPHHNKRTAGGLTDFQLNLDPPLEEYFLRDRSTSTQFAERIPTMCRSPSNSHGVSVSTFPPEGPHP